MGVPKVSGSPTPIRFRRRSSTGSMPSDRAISSSWDSMAKWIWAVPTDR